MSKPSPASPLRHAQREDAPVGSRRGPADGRHDLGPVSRLVSVAVGGAALAIAARRRDAWAAAAAATGLAFLARGATGRAPLKRALGASAEEKQAAADHGWSSATVHSRAVTIKKPRDELYDFFRDFSNLPRFMENIESIEVLDAKRSRWTVKAPRGTVGWEARVTHDEPGRSIGWESQPGADIQNAGVVEFVDAPGGRGTEVHAMIAYAPPGGMAGKFAAKLTQREPGIQARRDLKRLKMLMETGEIATNAPMGGPVKA